MLTSSVVAAAVVVDRGYRVLTEGLVFSRALTWAEWRACGAALAGIANRTTWAIGDWLVYAGGRGDYGEFYQEACAITGRSLESLSQHARVSQAFPINRRAVAVPWSFYREALRLPEHERQRSLLIAEQNHWTRDGLAAFISTRDGASPSLAKTISESSGTPHPKRANWQKPTHHRRVQCPSCGFTFEPKRRHRLTLASRPAAEVKGSSS